MTAQTRRVVAALVVALSLSATVCTRTPSASQAQPTPADGRSIRIETPSTGVTGMLFGSSSSRGVLVIAGDDDGAYRTLAAALARAGYRVLLYRQPQRDSPATARAAAAALRRQGVQKLVLVAGGGAVADALDAAHDGIDGVVALSPSGRSDPLPSLGMPSLPVLALASLTDAESSAQARRIYDAAVEPRMLALYPERGPAITIIGGAEPSALQSVLLDFLRRAFEPLSA
jgi:hypothetical protein